MYHTLKTSELDQHTHPFLWRDMDSTREPDTYIIQRVSFGDKPSGTIATIALKKTAEMTRNEYQEAADIIQNNTYMGDIGLESTWQKGLEFLKQPENKWPITRNYLQPQLPELVKTAMATNIEAFQDTLAGRIDKYSNYNKLLRVTARIVKLYDRNPKSSLKNATNDLTPHDLEKAELFWIREAQQNIGKDIENGKYKRLCPKMGEDLDGVYVIRGRSELWMEISIYSDPDLFGPYRIRNEVKKRTTSKTYGVIFTCLGTRAVYLDIAANYSTDKFLMVLRRFVSLHGYPSKLFSDNGTQLVAANKELSNITKIWDWNKLKGFGVTEGFELIFTSTDAPWQNGVTEALTRSVKRAINPSIGDSILTFSELQTVL